MQKRSHRAEIIAKFEDQQALQHRDEIIEACDAVMVARGDLGIEAHLEELPIIQRRLVKECVRRGRLVIVATHMLESMIENPVPTRAEVTDVAQAVLEQADAIMLSGETSTGQHPVRCVQMMDRIARRIEQEIDASAAEHQLVRDDKHRVVRAAAALADSFDDASLLVFTQRGVMGRYAAQCRPVSAPIYAFSASAAVCRRLALHRGVLAFPLEFEQGNSTQAIDLALEKLRQSRRVAPGQTLVITSDILHEQGATDAILVRKV
jgi:pyruvate kinase